MPCFHNAFHTLPPPSLPTAAPGIPRWSRRLGGCTTTRWVGVGGARGGGEGEGGRRGGTSPPWLAWFEATNTHPPSLMPGWFCCVPLIENPRTLRTTACWLVRAWCCWPPPENPQTLRTTACWLVLLSPPPEKLYTHTYTPPPLTHTQMQPQHIHSSPPTTTHTHLHVPYPLAPPPRPPPPLASLPGALPPSSPPALACRCQRQPLPVSTW